jgi:hypothetical protein
MKVWNNRSQPVVLAASDKNFWLRGTQQSFNDRHDGIVGLVLAKDNFPETAAPTAVSVRLVQGTGRMLQGQ